MSRSATDQLNKARERARIAAARVQQLESRLNAEARKRDTRRKIIMGGLLLDAAEKDAKYAPVVRELFARISRDNDKEAFKEWELFTLLEERHGGTAASPATSGSCAPSAGV